MRDETRRTWFVVISQAAVGCAVANQLSPFSPDASSLPPGLYVASKDHLGHALMSAEGFHPIPADCPTDYVRPPNGPFKPSFFDDSQFAMVLGVVALLLGEVSENGRPETNLTVREVGQWVDLRFANTSALRDAARGMHPSHRLVSLAYLGSAQVEEMETANPKKIFDEGLAWLASESYRRFSNDFLNLRPEEQSALLNDISDDRADKQLGDAGTKFFELLKGETIRGFYTSRLGLKELDFRGNAYYARSPGCGH
jgi:hypothetical protein